MGRRKDKVTDIETFAERPMTELEKAQQALYASRLVVRRKDRELDELSLQIADLKKELEAKQVEIDQLMPYMLQERVHMRDNRLKRLKRMKAPDYLINKEKAMLTEEKVELRKYKDINARRQLVLALFGEDGAQ